MRNNNLIFGMIVFLTWAPWRGLAQPRISVANAPIGTDPQWWIDVEPDAGGAAGIQRCRRTQSPGGLTCTDSQGNIVHADFAVDVYVFNVPSDRPLAYVQF